METIILCEDNRGIIAYELIDAGYLLNTFGLGRVGARRKRPRRRNVFCDRHELLSEDVHWFLVTGHSLGAMTDTLCQGKPS